MSAGFLLRKRHPYRRKAGRTQWKSIFLEYYPTMVTIFLGCLLALMLTGVMRQRLCPLIHAAARTGVENKMISVMETVVSDELERSGIDYGDLICIERIADGSITAITTDMAVVNGLRGELMEALMPELMKVDRQEIAVPVGSLLDSELLWGRGPTVKVRSVSVGSLRAEVESEFQSAGTNQTLHRIWLNLSAPTTVMLPCDQLEVVTKTRLCIAETVIVGEVPDYLQKVNG